nr:unnamed protein product [Callosobruchus analis]
MQGIPNLGTFSKNELSLIQDHLSKVYTPKALVNIEENLPFQILQQSKLSIVHTDEEILCILKIPILQKLPFNLYYIHPLPNSENIILEPPTTFYLSNNVKEAWTDTPCKQTEKFYICLYTQRTNICSLENTYKHCLFHEVKNDYFLYKRLWSQNALIFDSKSSQTVVEKCEENVSKFTLKGSYILNGSCDIIIDEEIFHLSDVNFTIHESPVTLPNLNITVNTTVELNNYHFLDLQELKTTLKQMKPISSQDLKFYHTNISSGFSILVVIIILVMIYFIYAYFPKCLFFTKTSNPPTVEINLSETRRNRNEDVSI